MKLIERFPLRPIRSEKQNEEAATPIELVTALMEFNDLQPKDMIPFFGTQSRVSEFLSGKRKLSVEQAKNLSERFKIRLDALLK